MRKSIFLLISGFLIISLLTSCSPQPTGELATARQETVDAVKSLPEGYINPANNISNLPLDSPRLEGWFDANEYFSVLSHLSMQTGYVLDYVYHNSGSSGQPYLYARPVDSKPFNTLDELNNSYTDKTIDHTYDYLSYVKADDTPESFFQYVVLRIMGGQFYLFWHAAYNDRVIICDRERLETLLGEKGYSFAGGMPDEVKNQARQLDLTPRVFLSRDAASVRIMTFTKWGGFIEETYTISREFPHIFQKAESKTPVPWKINLTF